MQKKAFRASAKRRLGTALLCLGVLMEVIVAGYLLAQYPWSYLGYRLGGEVRIPADPAPLSVPYTFPGDPPPFTETELMPGANNDVFRPRPALALTYIGTIKIPLLGVAENIVEGVGDEMLYAVGHIPGTAYPGQEGNCALAAHRDHWMMHPFMHLSKLSAGDRVLLEDVDNRYTYEIYETFTVLPDEVWVAQRQEGESHMLTLITCSPTYQRREICWARLVEVEEKVVITEG